MPISEDKVWEIPRAKDGDKIKSGDTYDFKEEDIGQWQYWPSPYHMPISMPWYVRLAGLREWALSSKTWKLMGYKKQGDEG